MSAAAGQGLAETPVPEPGARIATLLLVIIVALAAWLRLGNLAEQSLWWDEVVSWQQSRLGLGELFAATARDNYPPLQNILIHYSMLAFGETEFGIRLPSALIGIANVVAIYWLGTLFGTRRTGLIAAALLALSTYHVWYSQEGRMYALMALSATLYAGCALQFWRRPGGLWATLSTLAATALLYSHPYGALTWGAIAAGLAAPALWQREFGRVFRFALLQLVPLILFIPWALVLLNRAAVIDAQGFWIPPVSPWLVLQYIVALLSGPFLFAALGVGARLAIKPPLPEGLVLLACWIVLPLLAGIALSLLIEPLLVARYLIGTLPAMLVLIAIGFSRSNLLAFAGLTAAGVSGFFFVPEPRDDLRSVAKVLTAELGPTDCVMTTADAANGLSYYRPAPLPCLIATWSFTGAKIPAGTNQVFVITGARIPQESLGLETLGTVTARREFGITALLTLDPK